VFSATFEVSLVQKGLFMSRYLSLAVGACLLLATQLSAAPLLVDINDRTGAPSTQAGFVGVNQTGATGIVTDFGTLDLSFVGVAGTALDDRDRGALVAGQPLSDMLRDIVFISENLTTATGDGILDLVIDGLDAGNYKFVGYFHDNNVNHVAGDVAVSTDGGVTFTNKLDDVLYSFGTDPQVVGMGMFQFAANGNDPVVVRLTGQGGLFNITSGAFTDQDTALLSGFELHQVPEPGTLVGMVLSLGLVAAWRLRQRV
jgi:hypothetical protein